uniref:Uncharacterized protein n=1 Tax=Myotis myotis TaxID=51298 RepID=A0A7J7S1X6_MYOMY|nr:hypothetical protein mMyoMyo1_010027 [Myotis myotis]
MLWRGPALPQLLESRAMSPRAVPWPEPGASWPGGEGSGGFGSAPGRRGKDPQAGNGRRGGGRRPSPRLASAGHLCFGRTYWFLGAAPAPGLSLAPGFRERTRPGQTAGGLRAHRCYPRTWHGLGCRQGWWPGAPRPSPRPAHQALAPQVFLGRHPRAGP